MSSWMLIKLTVSTGLLSRKRKSPHFESEQHNTEQRTKDVEADSLWQCGSGVVANVLRGYSTPAVEEGSSGVHPQLAENCLSIDEI